MDIAQLRVCGQRIDGEKFQRPEEVVRWLGALQAQDYRQALWAIGLRTQKATVTDIEQAIAERKILRTWPQRGTIHFVPAEDAGWMLQLTAQRVLAADKRRQEQLELDAAILARSKELFLHGLQGGKRLTRSAMMKLLEDAGISTRGQRGYHLLWYMAQSGLICFGPIEEKEQTFVLLNEWVPARRELSREEALAVLAERYFVSRGPATVRDFAWWTGLTLTEARQGLEAIKAGLIREKISEQEYWMARDTLSQNANAASIIHLLPGFDEYLLGYRDRSAVLAAEYAQRIVPGNNGIFQPAVVVAGQIVGTWRRRAQKKTNEVLFQPFTLLQVKDEEISKVVKRYCDFLGLPCSSVVMQASNEVS
ncbi:winged helix DNA-binding domain-containing protein [Ktedonosporobacter rubrisoli]|uniref:Winged helix DNA-binding domain-containing protein n=1 Tax=Ktedonosporobacter rubrisoli TaxID=2509675 RepID=A0A4P6JNI5_KTERU|nr:winged helix DNA-binding domain-containing protein [Ktedonosporobacter rubrisoli]QBD76670.1 winged helix DNA-binding domain-containing protein [Ktedonosporobacter rubrisoli]